MSLNSSNLLPTGPCSFNLQWHNEISFITIEIFQYVHSLSLKTERLPRWELSTEKLHAVWYTYQIFPCYFAGFRNRPDHFLNPVCFSKGWSEPSLHPYVPSKPRNMKDPFSSFLVRARQKNILDHNELVLSPSGPTVTYKAEQFLA